MGIGLGSRSPGKPCASAAKARPRTLRRPCCGSKSTPELLAPIRAPSFWPASRPVPIWSPRSGVFSWSDAAACASECGWSWSGRGRGCGRVSCWDIADRSGRAHEYGYGSWSGLWARGHCDSSRPARARARARTRPRARARARTRPRLDPAAASKSLDWAVGCSLVEGRAPMAHPPRQRHGGGDARPGGVFVGGAVTDAAPGKGKTLDQGAAHMGTIQNHQFHFTHYKLDAYRVSSEPLDSLRSAAGSWDRPSSGSQASRSAR